MPFSTGLLAEFITYRIALVVYRLNLLLLGVVLYVSIVLLILLQLNSALAPRIGRLDRL
jgi:hypothetical protein